MKRNKRLSKAMLLSGILLNLSGIVGMLIVWVGDVHKTPADIVSYVLFEDSRYTAQIMWMDASDFIRGMSVALFSSVAAMGLMLLSKRFKYDSWRDLQEAEAVAYKESIIDCGTVQSVEIINGGFLGADYVVFRTDEETFRCIGSVSSIKTGIALYRQYNELIVTDNGRLKRLPIA